MLINIEDGSSFMIGKIPGFINEDIDFVLLLLIFEDDLLEDNSQKTSLSFNGLSTINFIINDGIKLNIF